MFNFFHQKTAYSMLQTAMNTMFQDREEAGYLLSKTLSSYKDSNAVVVGIPYGGACVASAIAEALSLPLEVMPCRTIMHPADAQKTLGSVSGDDVFLHDCAHTIPQDYIYHQIALLRNSILHANKRYYGEDKPVSFRYRPVILVDDVLVSSDTMMACLRGIRKQHPLKIIVAVPVVVAEAARIVRAEADEFVFLKMDPFVGRPQEYFVDFPKVDKLTVKELLDASRKAVRIHE